MATCVRRIRATSRCCGDPIAEHFVWGAANPLRWYYRSTAPRPSGWDLQYSLLTSVLVRQ
jgi:hypothetical protein